jgi:hypothetical protein
MVPFAGRPGDRHPAASGRPGRRRWDSRRPARDSSGGVGPTDALVGTPQRPLADALERGAQHGLIHVPDPLTTAHLLGAALGGSLCGAVVYGSPPLERLVPASKDMFRRALAAPDA